jgi:two-component system LytT family response regulator
VNVLKAIIVEDSRLARLELKALLELHPEVEIIDEAKNIEIAQEKIEALNPDLIFLDINMPNGNGFELLERLAQCPYVIFTTAYSEFALKAFEVNALDYLVKPIHPKRLAGSIEKLNQRILETTQSYLNQQTSENGNIPTPKNAAELPISIEHKIFVKDGEQCWLIDVAKIRYFESCGNYAKIYFETHKPMIYKSLNLIEQRLNPNIFIRTNRQFIVNTHFIRAIETNGNTGLMLTMDDGRDIDVSRRHTNTFKHLLSL